MKNKGGIIVEGPDQFGKSTLCKKLQKKLNMPLIHYKPPKPGTPQFMYYTHLLDGPDGPYIFDRNYVSELVYGPLFRVESAINAGELKSIENKFELANYFIVLLERKNYEWEARDEMYSKDQNKQVIAGYEDISNELGLDIVTVDAFTPGAVETIYNKWLKKNNRV